MVEADDERHSILAMLQDEVIELSWFSLSEPPCMLLLIDSKSMKAHLSDLRLRGCE